MTWLGLLAAAALAIFVWRDYRWRLSLGRFVVAWGRLDARYRRRAIVHVLSALERQPPDLPEGLVRADAAEAQADLAALERNQREVARGYAEDLLRLRVQLRGGWRRHVPQRGTNRALELALKGDGPEAALLRRFFDRIAAMPTSDASLWIDMARYAAEEEAATMEMAVRARSASSPIDGTH